MVQIYSPVYNWARRTGLQPQDAADVAQETFAAVSTRLSRFDPQQAGATFRGWLWTITRNKAADFVLRRDAQPRAPAAAILPENLPSSFLPAVQLTTIPVTPCVDLLLRMTIFLPDVWRADGTINASNRAALWRHHQSLESTILLHLPE